MRAAEERQERGEPPHLADMILRLMRVTVARNTELEVRSAEAKDASSASARGAPRRRARDCPAHRAPWRRRAAVARGRGSASPAPGFPFRHDRALPLTIVRGDPGDLALDPSFRSGLEWPVETKQALIDLGYELTSGALRARG